MRIFRRTTTVIRQQGGSRLGGSRLGAAFGSELTGPTTDPNLSSRAPTPDPTHMYTLGLGQIFCLMDRVRKQTGDSERPVAVANQSPKAYGKTEPPTNTVRRTVLDIDANPRGGAE